MTPHEQIIADHRKRATDLRERAVDRDCEAAELRALAPAEGRGGRMRNAPNGWTLEGLSQALNSGNQASPDGKLWYPARPCGYYSLANRLRLAWAVFTGRADAVFWPGGQ